MSETARHLSLNDLTGLLHGDEEAYRHVLEFANSIAWTEGKMKGIDDVYDIAMDALLEGVKSVQDGECASPDVLAQVVKRSVWRKAQQTYRRMQKQIDVPIESIVDSVEPWSKPELWSEPELASTEEPEPPHPRLLFDDRRSSREDALVKIDILAVDRQFIAYLNAHPERMYELNPRKFEELVAAILKDLGYTVQLTARGADGGVDIIATQKNGVGDVLLLVDCKRYTHPRKVGVEIVRSLFAIGEQRRATMTMLATTSHFTTPAQDFQRTLCHRLALKDYDDLTRWISEYGTHS